MTTLRAPSAGELILVSLPLRAIPFRMPSFLTVMAKLWPWFRAGVPRMTQVVTVVATNRSEIPRLIAVARSMSLLITIAAKCAAVWQRAISGNMSTCIAVATDDGFWRFIVRAVASIMALLPAVVALSILDLVLLCRDSLLACLCQTRIDQILLVKVRSLGGDAPLCDTMANDPLKALGAVLMCLGIIGFLTFDSFISIGRPGLLLPQGL